MLTEFAALRDISADIWLVTEHCVQGINVLITVKCFAHMFPNTHSWYHSMSARPEEAVSYRCQYPCWPLSLPPPLHTHGTGGLSPRTKKWGLSVEKRQPNILCTMESGRQVQLVHTLLYTLYIPLCLKTMLELHTHMGYLVMPVCSWWSYVLRDFLLLLPPCWLRNKPLEGHLWQRSSSCKIDGSPKTFNSFLEVNKPTAVNKLGLQPATAWDLYH